MAWLKTPRWMNRSVRHKLLAIALLPLAVVFPLLVLALMLWSHVAYDRLLTAKVRADLAVANGYFQQVLYEVGAGTRGVALSLALHQALASARAHGGALIAPPPGGVSAYGDRYPELAALHELLLDERERLGLDILVLVRPDEATPELATDATDYSATLRLMTQEELAEWAPHLLERTGIPLVETRNASPTERDNEDRAMVMLASLPVPDAEGRPWAVLHGGLLLNQNLAFIDHINRIVYPEGSLPFGSVGTATLFLDDVRITTNVRLFQDQRAIGTRVSQAVRDAVLGRGETWLDRAFVVNDWYVSAYQPLQDARGERVGMLYVGYLERPYRWMRYGMLGVMGFIFLAVMTLAAVFSVRWARSIFRPVEQMNETIKRIEDGESGARVGPIAARDELGALANHLDHLLDVVEDNTRRLREWAETLDLKVQERTRELEASNASLRQAQQQLVKSEKLAAIGQLTASVAHEINNPIAVMQGNLDLIRHELGPAADPVRGEFRLLDEQIERMRLIVTQLLQYARPTEFAGYVDQQDVNQVAADCLVLVGHLLQQRGIRVEQDYRARARAGINRQELQQVIINLMINAVQAMPDKGCLTLRTLDWVGDTTGTTLGAIVEVADTGPGLSPAVLERLFSPFFTTKNDGNGLGLWISQGLVERYGGRLEADNRTDEQGAVFRLRLLTEPLVPSESQAPTGDGRPGRLQP
ncbi:sensor histidine kinase [Tepidicella xavieri]|jgi:signal transduction histidine kinase|uniref:histidine kinase n=1 Tax=Tepidicella xavieri TaxID=360241 RepID=A0A4R6TX13_9BURK|nr:cache domain-containing protein [Tepidicella xavieri]TDQ38420.1 HAMP domain-containing protein [Tepidicella xavieri]